MSMMSHERDGEKVGPTWMNCVGLNCHGNGGPVAATCNNLKRQVRAARGGGRGCAPSEGNETTGQGKRQRMFPRACPKRLACIGEM